MVLYFIFIQGILLYSWRSRSQPTVYKSALQRWTRDHWTQIYCIKSVYNKANGLSYGSQGNWHVKFMSSYWYNMYSPMSCTKSNIIYHQNFSLITPLFCNLIESPLYSYSIISRKFGTISWKVVLMKAVQGIWK